MTRIPDGKPAAVNADDVEPGFHAIHGHNDKQTRDMLICFTFGVLIGQNNNEPVPMDILLSSLNDAVCEKYPFLTEFSTKEVKAVLDKLQPIVRFDEASVEKR